MTISFRAAEVTNSGGSPRTVNKPAGTAAGDLLLLHVGTGANVTPSAIPDGFVLIDGTTIAGTDSIRVYAKTAGAGEPASYDVSAPSGNVTVGLVAVQSTLPAVVHAVAARDNAGAGDRVWDGVTNTVADTLLLCFGSFANSLGSTADGAMTERYDNGADPRLYVMTQAVAATGATGTRTATGTAMPSRCVTISLAETAALAAPSDLTATAYSTTAIDLTWTDNSDGETGFAVERSLAGAEDWSEIDTVGAGVESYRASGLTRGVAYDFRVRAYQD